MSATPGLLYALDPQRSAVVEACAGSGKTWLLVSRMLRLLLAGAAPGSILALTFTRKAAQEMRARLDGWLRELALATDEEGLQFLLQRGLTDAEARAALPRARSLYETVLTAQPGVAIDTFHGWFLRIIALAPLSPPGAGDAAHEDTQESTQEVAPRFAPPGATLIDAPGALLAEAWQRFAVELGGAPDSPLTQAFVRVLAAASLSATRSLLFAFANRRSEWWAYTTGHAAPAAFAAQQLRAQLEVSETDDPVADLLAGERSRMLEFAALLARNTATEQAQAETLTNLLQAAAISDSGFAQLRSVWLTLTGEPRKRKAGAAQQKRLTAGGEALYLELHDHLARAVQAADAVLLELRICAFNDDAFLLGDAFIATYQRL